MKNDKENKAQILSETLDQVDDDLLQQAHDVDTAEKFHALSDKQTVAVVKDRPVTLFRKAAAIAASLAVAIALAFGVTALLRNFPGIWNPGPTDPHMTQPPITTPTEPTEPTEPAEPELPVLSEITISNESRSEPLTLHAMLWKETFDATTGTWLSADGSGADGILYKTDWAEEPHLPVIMLNPPPDGTVTLNLSENATLNDVRVYLQNGIADYTEIEDFPGTIEALLDLPGSWFVVINVTWQGRYIETEDRYEQHCYEYIFTVSVAQQILPEPSDPQRDITVSSGAQSVTDLTECLVWKNVFENGWVFTEGSGAYGYLNTGDLTAIPILTLDKAVTIQLGDNGVLDAAEVYFQTQNGQWAQYADLPASVDSLAELPLGTWYIAVRITWNGQIIEEHEQYEQFCTEHLFILEVTQQSNVENPGGICGENARWEFDPTTGTLTISGTGAMADAHPDPWLDYTDKILQIIIEPGITSIGGFSSLRNLTDVQIPNSVVTLQEEAFLSCVALETITLPDSITFIGDRTFDGCSSLQSIRLPSDITAIGRLAFSGCYSLTAITLPDSITTIGNSAFSGCGLTELHLPDSVTAIDDGAFRNCWALKSITFGSRLTSIGNSAFVDCTNLTEIILPDSVTSVGDYAFWGCSKLTRVRLSPNIKHINQATFYECGMLSEVVIPAGVTSIQLYAFYLCTNLAAIDIPNTMTTIGEYAFYGCGLTELHLPDSVTTIQMSAFEQCTALTRVTLPATITELADGLFSGCAALSEIQIPGSVRSIGYITFSGCESLQSIIIPDSVTILGKNAFYYCSNLQHVTLSKSLTEIADSAFLRCTALTQITIPEGVTQIGSNAFNQCAALESVILPGTLTIIGDSAFANSGLREIAVPSSVTNLASHAFSLCHQLERIVIPACVSFAGWELFYLNENLTHIFCEAAVQPERWNANWNNSEALVYWGGQWEYVDGVPTPILSSNACGDNLTWTYSNGVLTITGTGDMYDYSNRNQPPWREFAGEITQLQLAVGITRISISAFLGLSQLKQISIPNTVTSIGMQAFSECTALTTLVIPDSVEQIGSMAFSQCTSLQTIVIGTGITTIDMNAFLGCHKLEWVEFTGDMPYMEEAFYGLTLTIYYPADNSTWDPGKVSTYETSITWIPVEMTP